MSEGKFSATRIRLASVADAAEIARLSAQLGYPVAVADLLPRVAALAAMQSQYLAVAQGSGTNLLGWIHARRKLTVPSPEHAEIVGLVVDAAARRGGVGRALIEAAQQWTLDIGLAAIAVRSNIARDASHRFYQSLGFGRVKTQHAYMKSLRS